MAPIWVLVICDLKTSRRKLHATRLMQHWLAKFALDETGQLLNDSSKAFTVVDL
jgi:hypothetical protein